MSTLVREPGETYRVTYGQVALERMANSERCFPAEWLTDHRTDVTDSFVQYATPLIGEGFPCVSLITGLPRFAHLDEIYAEQKLPIYTPVNYR